VEESDGPDDAHVPDDLDGSYYDTEGRQISKKDRRNQHQEVNWQDRRTLVFLQGHTICLNPNGSARFERDDSMDDYYGSDSLPCDLPSATRWSDESRIYNETVPQSFPLSPAQPNPLPVLSRPIPKVTVRAIPLQSAPQPLFTTTVPAPILPPPSLNGMKASLNTAQDSSVPSTVLSTPPSETEFEVVASKRHRKKKSTQSIPTAPLTSAAQTNVSGSSEPRTPLDQITQKISQLQKERSALLRSQVCPK